MIRGIQTTWKRCKEFPSGITYIKRPFSFIVDCSLGSLIVTAKELEKYLKDRANIKERRTAYNSAMPKRRYRIGIARNVVGNCAIRFGAGGKENVKNKSNRSDGGRSIFTK